MPYAIFVAYFGTISIDFEIPRIFVHPYFSLDVKKYATIIVNVHLIFWSILLGALTNDFKSLTPKNTIFSHLMWTLSKLC